MKSTSSHEEEFARIALKGQLVQVTCLHCLAIVGTASSERAATILEHAHKCKAGM